MGKQILLFGIGQTGCTVAELFSRKAKEAGLVAAAFAMDTDERTLDGLSFATPFSLAHEGTLSDVVERFGADRAMSFFPCDWERDATDFAQAHSMKNGAGLWRAKAYLSFLAFLADKKKEKRLSMILESAAAEANALGESICVRIVASLVGGTGSALFMPLAMFVKARLAELGAKVCSVEALLVMPDVYEDALSPEQKIKGRANAYAALRELHTVDVTTATPADVDYPPVDFRIGMPKGTSSLYFDAAREEFHTPAARPFDRVVLFDRIPALGSLGMHLDNAADILFCECAYDPLRALTPTEKIDGAPYRGVSTTKVEYPRDSIVSYIAKQQTYDLFCEKDGAFAFALARALEREEKYAITYGGIDRLDIPATYAALCLREAEKCEREILTETSFAAVDAFLAFLAGGDDYAAISAKLSSTAVTKHRGLFVGRQGREALVGYAGACEQALLKFYKNAQARLVVEPEEFLSPLAAGDAVFDFSLKDYLSDDAGHPLSPSDALIRLCMLRDRLEEKEKKEGAFLPANYLASRPPYEKFKPARSRGLFRTGYQKKEASFSALFLHGDAAFADDEVLFRRDVTDFLSYLYDGFFCEAKRLFLSVVDRLIAGYRTFFRSLAENAEKVGDDLRLAKTNGSLRQVGYISVGADPAQKEALYDAYRAALRESGAPLSGDASMSALLRDSVFADTAADAAALLRKAERLATKQLTSSAFFRDVLDVDVIAAATRTVGKSVGKDLSSLFACGNTPLRINAMKGRAHRATLAILSPAAIETAASLHNERDAMANLQGLLFEGGAEDAQILSSEQTSSRTMTLYCEMRGFALAALDEYCESAPAEALAYRDYLRARDTVRLHNTQMWNPALLYRREDEYPLPYICPVAGSAYEHKCAKALLAALASEELYLGPTEDGARAYFLRTRAFEGPILLGGKPIGEKQLRRLALYAYANSAWTEAFAAKYDLFFIAPLSALRSAQAQPGAVTAHLGRARTVSLFDTFASLITRLYDGKSAEISGFARTVSDAVVATLAACGKRDSGYPSEGERYLYNAMSAAFAERIVAACTAARAKAILAALSAVGCLQQMDYTGALHPSL